MSRTGRKRSAIAGAFVAHSLEMRSSPAWMALPDNARRVLDRLELEHMHTVPVFRVHPIHPQEQAC
jgi:hypothetical protein